MVDFADSDGSSRAATLSYSSASRRTFGDPSTFNTARLDPPRVFESTPPFVAAMMRDDTTLFVLPSATIASVYGFENRLLGSENVEDVDSPEVLALEMPVKPVKQARGFDVYLAPKGMTPWATSSSKLVTFQAGRPVAEFEFEGSCDDEPVAAIHEKAADSCTLLAVVCQGPHNPVGVGECGACPGVSFEVIALDSAGRMRRAGVEGPLECQGLDLEILPASQTSFGFRCEKAEDPENQPKPSSWTFQWSQYTKACGQK